MRNFRTKKVVKNNFDIMKEYYSITREENRLLNFIINNIGEMDDEAVKKVIEIIDELNESTYLYYVKEIETIEEAIGLEQEYKADRTKTKKPSLIETDDYRILVIALMQNEESLREFLGYEQEFFDYIKERKKVVNSSHEVNSHECFVYPLHNDEMVLTDLRMVIPKVVDLDSAILAIRLYKKAYNIYLRLGQPYKKEIVTTEIEEENYKNVYLHNLAMKKISR